MFVDEASHHGARDGWNIRVGRAPSSRHLTVAQYGQGIGDGEDLI